MAGQKELGETFAERLQKSESSRSIQPLVELFSSEAEVINVPLSRRQRGKQGVELFWQEYLDAFQNVQSQFTKVNPTDDGATLEWTARGTLADGRNIDYAGVSVVEFDEADKVKAFRTYYDTHPFH